MAGESPAVQLLDNDNHVNFNFLDDPPMLHGVNEQRHRAERLSTKVGGDSWPTTYSVIRPCVSMATGLFVASNFYHKRERES